MLPMMIVLVAALAAFASVLAVALPLLTRSRFTCRLKAVTSRRQELSRVQRASLKGRRKGNAGSRFVMMRAVVSKLRLQSLLDDKPLKNRLAMAGWRGQSAPLTYIFARVALPVVLLAIGLIYTSTVFAHLPLTTRLMVLLGATTLGAYLPAILVANAVQKRQVAIARAFPDALDLIVICVDAGLSVEAALGRVIAEMGFSSPDLAAELGLTGAELTFLNDRRLSWTNLVDRVGLPQVKSLATTLLQTEKYGTPVSQALRVLSQENRESRMAEAEKKAAALPARLTVPMILFFLPVLFMVIAGPAVIQVAAVMR
ncbi:MAG: type II secretion system F family protein [Alphaproteobacteria bacterium]|nr:type II secretion system F family protein [Alphaproteobacteria bacterium]